MIYSEYEESRRKPSRDALSLNDRLQELMQHQQRSDEIHQDTESMKERVKCCSETNRNQHRQTRRLGGSFCRSCHHCPFSLLHLLIHPVFTSPIIRLTSRFKPEEK
ncbi:hypothetical protein EXN66_Car006079 [Channa argus]|uniref:Uncharacterized protein n=1 Tax=Channa argus TaxID=215402 RepID=A0A6G1PK66_CHAAH|nr:hypothetical protein EXN66_Car006079 [Channa argus]